MTDSVGPGKLVRHMQNLSYAYDGLSPSYASVYLIVLGTSVDLYKKVKTAKEYAWLDFYYTFICLLRNTRQCELSCCLAERNISTCVGLGKNKPTARHMFVRHTQC